MESLITDLSDYWWAVVLPAVLILFIWIFQGRWLRWAFLFFVAGFVFFYVKDGRSTGVGSALSQMAHHIVGVVRQVGASLL